MSLRLAEALVRDGFKDDTFIAVTEHPPDVGAGGQESHAVVMIGAPFGFDLADYPVQTNSYGIAEYLVPASVLNQLQRGVWPLTLGQPVPKNDGDAGNRRAA